jgi:exonuclease SbcC
MKIISIRLKNINSLKDEHTIDFTADPLASAGLFVITGPTGSGKSTILDAITLALYGRIPRLKHLKINHNLVEKEGIILTRHTNDCFTEVVYEVKGKRYRSSWSMSRNRNKKLNDRKQELFDIDGDCILSEKNDDVIKKNEEIIGLNYEQFVQSLILAQGKFAKLLQAPRSERNALLETITGTEVYREIGKLVYERSNKAAGAVEVQKIMMKGIELLTEDQVKEFKADIEKKEPVREGLEKEMKSAQTLITVKENLVELFKKQEQNEIDFAALLIEEESLKAERTQLAKHDEMAVFRGEVNALDQEEKAIHKLNSDIIAWKADIKTVEKSNEQLIIDASSLIGERVADHELIDQVTAFKKLIQEKQKNIADEQLKMDQLVIEINRTLDDLSRDGLEIRFPELDEQRLVLERDKVKTAIEALKVKDLDELKAKRDELRNSYRPASELRSSRKEYNRDQSDFLQKSEELDQKVKSLASAHENLAELTKSLEKVTADKEKAQKDFEKIKAEQGLDALRSELIHDEPCPLCGSLEHPYHDTYEEKLLSTFEELLSSVNTLYTRVNSEFILTQGTINKLTPEIEEEKNSLAIAEEKIKTKTKELEAECIPFGWDLNAPLKLWDEALTEMNELALALDQGEKEFNKNYLLESLHVEFEKITPLKNTIDKLQKDLSEKYTGKDIEKDTQRLLDERNENKVKLEERSTRLQVAEAEVDGKSKFLSDALKTLLSKLNKQGIADLETYRLFILDELIAQQIRARLTEVDTKRTALATTKKSLSNDVKEQQEKDDVTKDIDALKIEYDTLSDSLNALSEELGTLKGRLTRNDEDIEKLQDSQTLLDQLKKDLALWGKMNDLIGEKTGNRFANFVQDLTFEQLIDFGNKRLASFSDRYMLAMPSVVDTGDLQVMDTYMGNTTRSIFSLSGGETFKLSLALALGLSDLAARKVEIESLFIDEGFGSLDPDSLEEAVSLLEDIQNKGNKSIGIISHVTELKDRIGTKVRLETLGSGYSKVVVE